MTALIGRDTDGWSTRGFVARLEDGRTLTAVCERTLVQQLRAAGVNQIQVADSNDGDRGLSAAEKSLLDMWQDGSTSAA